MTKLVACLLALGSAYVGAVGLVEMFGGSVWWVATLIEAGKLAVNVILTQSWKRLVVGQRVAAVSFYVVLLGISICGSFGYFLAAFSCKQEGVSVMQSQISSCESRIESVKKQISDMDALVKAAYKPDVSDILFSQRYVREDLNRELAAASVRQADLEQQAIAVHNSAGPLQITADTFGISAQMLARILIVGLVIVFDPLAQLLISCSMRIDTLDGKKRKGNITNHRDMVPGNFVPDYMVRRTMQGSTKKN
jgi:hypothetical protein